MKIKPLGILFLFAGMLGFTACGNGPYVEEKVEVSQFHSLELENLFVGTFEQSDQYSVTVEVPEKVKEYLTTKVENGRVSVVLDTEQMDQSECRHLEFHRPKVKVKAPNFQKVVLKNACYLDFIGVFNLTEAELKVRGASTVKMDKLSADDLNLDLSGASGAEIGRMKVGRLRLDLSGASTMNSTSSEVGTADLDLSGASTLNWIGFVQSGFLDASGASQVDWTPLYDKKGERMTVEASGVSKIRADHVRFNEVQVTTTGLSSVRIDGQQYE